ncbi:MAG: DUF4097 domain-containing protein [Firmicutes bacterium]|nr:DUF4097 domain-containing protein [Bacillota bacterium]
MKRFKIICWVLIAAGLGLAIAGMGVYGFDFNAMAADFRGEHHFVVGYATPETTPTSVRINIRSQNVIVRTGDDFRIDYHMNVHYSTVTNRMDGDEWVFEKSRRWAFSLFDAQPSHTWRVYVTIPANFNGPLVLDNRSGNMDIEGLTLENLTVNGRSGNISIRNTTVRNLTIDNRSGNVNANINTWEPNWTVANYRIDTTTRSGLVRLNGNRVGSGVQSNGTDGNIRITNRSGNINLRLT